MAKRATGRVALERALSKLGLLSRAEARRRILEGRVAVAGRVVRDPYAPVVPERAAIALDGEPAAAPAFRCLMLHKPRGVVTSARDPDGRRTVFDLARAAGETGRLVAVGRLDLATTGLLLLTNDTRLADWLTDPSNRVPRVYTVTVRGEVSDEAVRSLTKGIDIEGGRMAADEVTVRKRSRRETHLVVRLHEGRNREIRRLLEAVGHEVTSLRRVAFGGLELGALQPGQWRDVDRSELDSAFQRDPGCAGSPEPRAFRRPALE